MKTISLDGKWSSDGREFNVPSLFVSKERFEKNFSSLCAERAALAYVCEGGGFSLEKKVVLSEKDLLEENIVLHFDRLDTLCCVFVNEKKVGSFKNCHRSYDIDIKSCLSSGSNTIKVRFFPIEEYLSERQKAFPLPPNANGIPHHPHLRKPAVHFGWDFAPQLCAQGISGHSEIRLYSHPVLERLDVSTAKEGKKRIVCASVRPKEDCSVIFSLTHPDGRTEKLSAEDGYCVSFAVEDPKLWYCNGMGDQPLYTVSAAVIGEDGTTLHLLKKRVGFRTVYLDRKKDKYGTAFQFFVNGEPIFAKGANQVPFHMLYTNISREELFDRLKKCRDANMNMLRVWGGGFYESEDFYDICDELGLLVWQDCAFACSAYPFSDRGFMFEVKEEIAENVSRIKHHASLCLWCGNNEIESMSLAWLNRRSLIKETGNFFYKTLPKLIGQYDDRTPYHQCSPGSGTYMKDPSGDSSGDSHIWNVWHGFRLSDYYQKRTSRFCSETGMQSYPCFPLSVNQYCDLGEERLDFYLSKHFTLGRDENERRYLTQLLQLEYMKAAAEHFRRQRERCYGFLFWQLNDCWQSASWSAMDVKGNKKALMFGAKYFFEGIHISTVKSKDSLEVFVCNDGREPFEGEVHVTFESTSGTSGARAQKRVFVRAFSCESVMKVSLSEINRNESVFIAGLFSDGKKLSESRVILCENNELNLFDPGLTIETSVRAGRVYLTVTAEKYARYVELSCDGETSGFEDNYFDLSAFQSRTVEIYEPCAGISEMLSVRSLYDVMAAKDSRRDKKRYFEILRKPAVAASAFARIIAD